MEVTNNSRQVLSLPSTEAGKTVDLRVGATEDGSGVDQNHPLVKGFVASGAISFGDRNAAPRREAPRREVPSSQG